MGNEFTLLVQCMRRPEIDTQATMNADVAPSFLQLEKSKMLNSSFQWTYFLQISQVRIILNITKLRIMHQRSLR